MGGEELKRFKNGDVIHCYESEAYSKKEWIPVFNCDYEKSGYLGMGLIHALGNFKKITFEDASVEVAPLHGGFQFEFKRIAECKETVHRCSIVSDHWSSKNYLDCQSSCKTS